MVISGNTACMSFENKTVKFLKGILPSSGLIYKTQHQY